jgi:hypothetical protein
VKFKYWALVGVGFGLFYTALRQQWHSFMAGVLLVFAVLVTMAAVAAIYSMAEEREYLSGESFRESPCARCAGRASRPRRSRTAQM